jgi:hypothetical protein
LWIIHRRREVQALARDADSSDLPEDQRTVGKPGA